MKSHSSSNVESIGHAIRTQFPALSDIADDIEVAVKGYQPAEYLNQVLRRGGLSTLNRIQRIRGGTRQQKVAVT